MRTRLSCDINPEKVKKFKAYLALRGETVNSAFNEFVDNCLKKEEKKILKEQEKQ